VAYKKVLSIDGGGVRGIIPAMVLKEIEERTSKPICRLFDLIAGTSTGGILGLGLTVPEQKGSNSPKYGAEQLLQLYRKHGAEIFPERRLPWLQLGRRLLRPKHSPEGLERVLKEYFEDYRMGDAIQDVMVSGYNTAAETSWFFKSFRVVDKPERNYLMREVARATSAAPTVLPPAKVISPNPELPQYHPIVDGGVFANNPAMCAYVEALTLYPGLRREDVLLVSLSTGESSPEIKYDKAKRWGLVSWGSRILGVVFDGVSDSVDYQLKCLLRPFKTYYRLSPRFGGSKSRLDDASERNLNWLLEKGQDLVTSQRSVIDSICEALVEGSDSE